MAQPAPGVDTAMLLSYLNSQRRHVRGILEGLDDEALRRPVLPSGWSCLGVVQHLAIDGERFWFRAVIAGDPEVIDQLDATEADAWKVAAGVPADEILALYQRETELADALLADVSVAAAPAWWPEELFGNWRMDNVGEVILHVLTETTCHAGHLDAARELIDGRQWRVVA